MGDLKNFPYRKITSENELVCLEKELNESAQAYYNAVSTHD
jgi:hypothetical protein